MLDRQIGKILKQVQDDVRKLCGIAAFTLAEVLIVLGIIGVIAEMTIPTLVQNTQKHRYATMSEKAYSATAQFFKMYMAEQGINNLEDSDLSNDINNLDAAIHKYFKVIKVCKDPADTSCIVYEKYMPPRAGGGNQFSTGIYATYYFYIFQTADGIEFIYTITHPCTAMAYPTPRFQKSCASINFDINGASGPNYRGRDFQWSLSVTNTGDVYPNYSKEWSTAVFGSDIYYWRNYATACGIQNSPDLTNGGSGVVGVCLQRLMENNWVMDY